MDIICLPQLELIDAHGDHSYANFLCQYLLRNSDTEFGRFGGHLPPHIGEALALLRARLHFLPDDVRSEEHTSELQSLMRISYAVFCLKKKKHTTQINDQQTQTKIINRP